MENVENVSRELLLNIVIDAWKLSQTFSRVLARLGPEESARYVGQLRYFQKRAADVLAEVNLSIVNLEGELFEAGSAAIPLNISDFGPDDSLIVDQMIEPTVVDRSGIVRVGTVILKRVL